MFLIGYSLIKRIVFYVVLSIFWGFLFISMFSFIMGYGYNGYFYDSIWASMIMAATISVIFETMRIVIIKKYNKVKLEIAKEHTVIFDKPANLVIDMKGFEGWLFLTDKNIIFRSLKKKKPQNLFIPINSIQNIAKIKLAAFSINADNIQFRFVVSKRNQIFDLINSKITASI